MRDGPPKRIVPCVGCGGLVPDEDGPTHRYMTASPGCWRIYTELGAAGMPLGPLSGLTVDAYAVTHPGLPGPQSTPSVWIHLLTLCFVLERGWPTERAVRLRRLAADDFAGWRWLERPTSMGEVTVVDVADAASPEVAPELVGRWIEGAWAAWSVHKPAVRAQADALTERLR
jgi:hypothetical protein